MVYNPKAFEFFLLTYVYAIYQNGTLTLAKYGANIALPKTKHEPINSNKLKWN